ncbi:phosphotransferase [Sphingobium aromaticiconvertens]|uniref:phosphotransferase n=1 Tax=Sphingobium aromaticiconvertens TaxID=365341 RepID=UPI0030165256
MASDTIVRMKIDPATMSETDRPVYEWLHTHFGCVPQNFCRQLRWRIGWEADVEIDGRTQGVLVRGSRGKDVRYPITLHQEAGIHHVMERHGVPAPRVFGMIENPVAIVMERLPGGINTDLIPDSAVRKQVRHAFIDAMAKLHAVPIEEFAALGMNMPRNPRELALNLYQSSIDIARTALADRPLPLVTFLAKWLEDNVPEDRHRAAFVTADAGQFLFDGDRMTGLIDFEVSYIGDPAAEFAGMRLRDTTEPLGDISELRRYYETITGAAIPHKAIAYHTAGFSGTNTMLMWPMILKPEVQNDFIAYLQFTIACSRWSLQGIAESLGIDLDDVAEPEANTTVPFAAATAQLDALLTGWETSDAGLRFHLEGAAALAAYLERCHVYGGPILAADLADTTALVGRTVTTREEADAAVEAFVGNAAPHQDAALVRFFHRWLARQNWLLKGCGSQAYLTETTLQPIRD